MSLRVILCALFCCLLIPRQSTGQGGREDCEATLNKAVEEFNAGHFYGISSLLSNCLNNGFSREQRERAYLLLAQTYLLLDDPFGAEQSYLSVLQANPEFVTDENRDPIDVVYLSKKFTASPIFSWYIKFGGNTSIIRVIKDWSVIGGDQGSKKYVLSPGFQFGGGLEYNLIDNISLAGEVTMSFTSYRKDFSGFFNGRDEISLTDKQTWFNVPIMAKYSFKKGKLRPFCYGGFAVNLLIRDVASISKTDNEPLSTEGGNITTSESPSINYMDRRVSFNKSLFVGGGIKYKWGLDYLFADARYSFGMTNMVDPNRRFANYSSSPVAQDVPSQPWTKYAYIEDDFRMDNLFISVGYIKPLYKPRKLKVARTKSILKRIGKQKEEEVKDEDQ